MAAAQLLLADCGNQRLKLAPLSLQEVHVFDWREDQERKRLADFLQREAIGEIRLASSSEEGAACLKKDGFHRVVVELVQASMVPLKIMTQGTGIDRLLAAWYGYQKAQAAVVVADCGTAFTLDVVSADGRFLGGAIGAGLGLQEHALAQACPHLEKPNDAQSGIPADTASAVAAGTRRAFAFALQALAVEFSPSLGEEACRFLTGGDAPRLHALMPDWQWEEHMVLKGLAALPR
ncbi:MAG: hypothetical protein COA70_02150 [Planctomycetota bacterium]|nr:MAG: hypothetical protein COA70_02150 [Planctomycetota bacterium]